MIPLVWLAAVNEAGATTTSAFNDGSSHEVIIGVDASRELLSAQLLVTLSLALRSALCRMTSSLNVQTRPVSTVLSKRVVFVSTLACSWCSPQAFLIKRYIIQNPSTSVGGFFISIY